MSRAKLTEHIDALAERHGSLRALARVLEVDAGYLSRLRSGEKINPSAALLRRLGLRRDICFVPIEQKAREIDHDHT